MDLNEPLIGHKFVVSLQQIKIDMEDKPIKCKRSLYQSRQSHQSHQNRPTNQSHQSQS